MWERWGTFSVRDHLNDAPFVSDVLLYNRLVIPVPDPSDNSAASGKYWAQWAPERQADCLGILKVKTDTKDGMALTVPWGKTQRDRFRNRMSTATALAVQDRNPDAPLYIDPFFMTSVLVKDEFSPALPKGVAKAWKFAAYTSADMFRDDMSGIPRDPGRRLSLKIVNRFLTPSGTDPKHELLKRAVDLAATDDFRRKRSKFYELLDKFVEENIEDEKALEAFNTVKEKILFTILPISLSMSAAVIAGSTIPLVLGAAGAAIQLTRFCRFDRKPTIASGDFDAAAMIHDARRVLHIESIYLGEGRTR